MCLSPWAALRSDSEQLQLVQDLSLVQYLQTINSKKRLVDFMAIPTKRVMPRFKELRLESFSKFRCIRLGEKS
jgi:hypothetical protein